jgi:hypothetical protein
MIGWLVGPVGEISRVGCKNDGMRDDRCGSIIAHRLRVLGFVRVESDSHQGEDAVGGTIEEVFKLALLVVVQSLEELHGAAVLEVEGAAHLDGGVGRETDQLLFVVEGSAPDSDGVNS